MRHLSHGIVLVRQLTTGTSELPSDVGYLTKKQAAAYLGVSLRWLDRHRTQLPPTWKVAGKLRYTRDVLDQYLEQARYKVAGFGAVVMGKFAGLAPSGIPKPDKP